MLKRLAAGVVALTMADAPAIAQSACEPAKLAAGVDVYAADPFGARSWRVLQGLGDPMIEAATYGGDYWANQERWRKLAADIAPEGRYLQNFGYDCRISYGLETLEKRVASLGSQSKYVKQWLRVQDAVLQACSEQGAGEVALPAAMDIHPELAWMQAEDRAYQEASIAFYRDKAKAIELFRAIGKSDSPHRGAARYNAANLLANGKKLAEARAEANAILADPALADVHTITKELLGYIANLEDTAEGWTALIGEAIATRDTGGGDRRFATAPSGICPRALRHRLRRHPRQARRLVARRQAARPSDHLQGHRRCLAQPCDGAVDDGGPVGG
jgi:hypothetical protein